MAYRPTTAFRCSRCLGLLGSGVVTVSIAGWPAAAARLAAGYIHICILALNSQRLSSEKRNSNPQHTKDSVTDVGGC